MPVQKYEAPNNNSVYEPEGLRGARHTLFSGTEVLQAGAGGCTEVLAIVTATGNFATISQPPYRLKIHFMSAQALSLRTNHKATDLLVF